MPIWALKALMIKRKSYSIVVLHGVTFGVWEPL
jgi:hypothetical protein